MRWRRAWVVTVCVVRCPVADYDGRLHKAVIYSPHMVLRRFRRNREQEGSRYAYSRWDGSQTGFDLNSHDLLAPAPAADH